jgi:hypothetical protein
MNNVIRSRFNVGSFSQTSELFSYITETELVALHKINELEKKLAKYIKREQLRDML